MCYKYTQAFTCQGAKFNSEAESETKTDLTLTISIPLPALCGVPAGNYNPQPKRSVVQSSSIRGLELRYHLIRPQ